MLKTLTVWNFALLEQVEIEFDTGLNILTGETGAGKSILIDALGIVLGNRASIDMIRAGCEWLRVEAVFSLENLPNLKSFLEELAIDTNEDILIITRQITLKGKNIILANGSHITVTLLKQISEYLIDIHGQNENLSILKNENNFELLDSTHNDLINIKKEYQKEYSIYLNVKKIFEEKNLNIAEREQRLDLLRWQVDEIKNANLQKDEDLYLENQIEKLSNIEKISNNINQIYTLLQGNNNFNGILSDLSVINTNLENINKYDNSLFPIHEQIKEALSKIQDAFYIIRDYADNMDFNVSSLDEMQTRLNLIDKLKRKYGSTINKILNYLAEAQIELEKFENYDQEILNLENSIKIQQKVISKLANSLTTLRKTVADNISDKITKHLHSLGMLNAKFIFHISPLEDFSINGIDKINILFSANLGEPEKPLSKVASGGELARIALAIKATTVSFESKIGSMIFDEIDAGIGGKTAQMVAEKIALVAKHKQVLCITHLPQIACMADRHLYIHKTTLNEKTITQVKTLTDSERINEIARMTSGLNISSTSLDNAREMIVNSQNFKNGI